MKSSLVFIFSVICIHSIVGCNGNNADKNGGTPINIADFPDQPGTVYGRWSMNQETIAYKAPGTGKPAPQQSIHRNLYINMNKLGVEQTCYGPKQTLRVSTVIDAQVTGAYIYWEQIPEVAQKTGDDECRLQINSGGVSYRVQNSNVLVMTNQNTGEVTTASRISASSTETNGEVVSGPTPKYPPSFP